MTCHIIISRDHSKSRRAHLTGKNLIACEEIPPKCSPYAMRGLRHTWFSEEIHYMVQEFYDVIPRETVIPDS